MAGTWEGAKGRSRGVCDLEFSCARTGVIVFSRIHLRLVLVAAVFAASPQWKSPLCRIDSRDHLGVCLMSTGNEKNISFPACYEFRTGTQKVSPSGGCSIRKGLRKKAAVGVSGKGQRMFGIRNNQASTNFLRNSRHNPFRLWYDSTTFLWRPTDATGGKKPSHAA